MALIFKTSRPRIKELTQSIKDYTLLGISDKGVPTEFLISALLSYVPDITEAMTKFISDDNLAELEDSNNLAEDVAPSQKSVVEYIKTTSGIANAISGCPGGYIGKRSGGSDGVSISDPGNPGSYKKGTMDKSFFDTMRTGFAYIHTISSDTDSETPRLTWGGFGNYTNQREIHVSDLVKVSVNVSDHGLGYLWLLVQYINFEAVEDNGEIVNMWEVSGQVVNSSLDGARGGLASALDINLVPFDSDPGSSKSDGLSIGYEDPDDQSASWRYDDPEDAIFLSQFEQISTKVADDSQCLIELLTEKPEEYLPFTKSELNSVTLLFSVDIEDPNADELVKGYIYYKPIRVYTTIRIFRPSPGAAPIRITQYHIVLEPLLSLLNGLPGKDGSLGDVILDTNAYGAISNINNYWTIYLNPSNPISKYYFDLFASETQPHYIFSSDLTWGEETIKINSVLRIKLLVEHHGYGYLFYKVNEIENYPDATLTKRLTCSCIMGITDGSDGKDNVTEYSPSQISYPDDIEGAIDLSYPVTLEVFKDYAGAPDFYAWVSDLTNDDKIRIKIPVIGYKDCYIYCTVTEATQVKSLVSPTSYEYSSLDDITGELGISTLINRDSDTYLQVGEDSSSYNQYFRVPLTSELTVSQFKTFRKPKSSDDTDYRLLRIDNFSNKDYGAPNDLLSKEILVLVIVNDGGTKYAGYLFYEISAVNPIAGTEDSYLVYLDPVKNALISIYDTESDS